MDAMARLSSFRDRPENGTALVPDRAGNLWVATAGQGLWLVPRGGAGGARVEIFATKDGLSSDAVLSVFEDREGNIWVGTRGTHASLQMFSPRRVKQLTDLPLVATVAAGFAGEMWIGTATGLWRFEGVQRRRYGTADGLPSLNIQALHAGRNGELWVGTEAGIARFSGGRFEPLPLSGSLEPMRLSAMTLDSAGIL